MPFDPIAVLSEEQREQLAAYERLLLQFNEKINLISRPSEARVREEHTLHSLALAWKAFPPGAQVGDWGSGGGLPAVPLAIRFPDAQFTAVEAQDKKARAVRAIARRLGLENLAVWQGQADEWPGTAGWTVSRATAPLGVLWSWHQRIASSPETPGSEAHWRPGLLALKGGDLSEERAALREAFPAVRIEQHALRPLLGRDFFADKYIITVAAP